MTTATCQRKHLGLVYNVRALVHDHRGGERGGRPAGMALGHWLRDCILICRQLAERETRPGRHFYDLKATRSDTPPAARPHLLILPKQSTSWEPDIQLCEPRSDHHWPNNKGKRKQNGNHKIERQKGKLIRDFGRDIGNRFCSGSPHFLLE